MRTSNRVIVSAILLLFTAGVLSSASGLGLGKLKDKAKKKVEDRVDKKTDKAMDNALDNAEGKGKGSSDNKTNSEAQKQSQANGAAELSQEPGKGAWVNYDFVPGDKILFYDDFSKTNIGDFPRRIQLVQGNIEVAKWNGANYMRITSASEFKIPLPENLPERFTLETEVHFPNYAQYLQVYGDAGKDGIRNHTNWMFINGGGHAGIDGVGGATTNTEFPAAWVTDGLAQFKVMADGTFFKVYVNDQRVANIPNCNFHRSNFISFVVYASSDNPALMSSIRIAAGGRKILYDELSKSGRVATQGIYFDSGSDVLRPESTPTLADIASMLKEHKDLKLMIEGHTDATGNDASNLDLSKRRAESVKNYLVQTQGIATERLQTQGFGSQKPVDSNDTPEGRQNNRRVELVKL